MSIEVVETHTILPDIVSPGSIVVDCGANVGRFSLEMIRRFGCLCYALLQQGDVRGKAAAILDLQTRARSCRSYWSSALRRYLLTPALGLVAPGGQQAAGCNQRRNMETATK